MRSLLLVLAVLALVRPSDACAPAPPRGEEVRIAEEEALIIWDPATKTEQFIRRAAFRSTTRQFGFLVPTPTIPQLGEAPAGTFDLLAREITPRVTYDRSERTYQAGSWLIESCMLTKGGAKDEATAPPPVRVLQTAHVAGFDATTVEADDARALTEWLASHAFEATPQLTAWLERYVTEHWKITAFVVATDDAQASQYEVATRVVKMTFPTERPFYPYREPQIDMTVESTAKLPPVTDRTLRVYFVSTERYAATLAGAPWSAKLLQAGKFEPYGQEALFGAHRYLTVFVDDSSPRRGLEELYFAPSTDQRDVSQPPQVVRWPTVVTIPVDVIILLGAIAFYVVRRVRRR